MKTIKLNKKINCEDLLQCIFDLNQLDLKVYKKLKQKKKIKTTDLAKELNKERSTVYRSLQKLHKHGICTKKRKNITTGGYYYIYKCNPNREIKKELEKCIDEWYKKMKKTVKQLE